MLFYNNYSLPTACWGENEGSHTHSIFHDQIAFKALVQANRKTQEAILYGQFPEILTTTKAENKYELLTNYKNTYFTRDLMQLSNIENIEGLYAIFNHLIRSIGSHLEVSNFAREAGISYPTTKKYLNTLLQSQLIFKLYGYQYGPAKRDINNLIEFEKQLKRPVQKYLFYSGTEYAQINQVQLLPVACLHRGI